MILHNPKTTSNVTKTFRNDPVLVIVGFLTFFVVLSFPSCDYNDCPGSKDQASDSTLTANWINWNILFPAGTTSAEREKLIGNIEILIRQTLTDSINARGNCLNGGVVFKIHTCICDSLLVLLQGDLDLWGTTGSNTNPPKPPDPGASGGGGTLVDVNEEISLPDNLQITVDSTSKERPEGTSIQKKFRLAILDTGIDPSLFFPGTIEQLFWNDPNVGLSNFLIGANPHDYKDDNLGRHGSAVTALALRQFRRDLPGLMILKVLDRNGKGSAFTLSCALSYTAQNKAQLVNASLGYFGKSDPILNHYVNRNVEKGNYLIAAAGNVPGNHNQNELCSNSQNPEGLLGNDKLFFPACYMTQPQRLISVTGLKYLSLSCYYQNYSKTYVHLGFINTQNCCTYDVAFLRAIEGSSFATPIVAGRIGNFMIGDPGSQYGLFEIYTGINVQSGH